MSAAANFAPRLSAALHAVSSNAQRNATALARCGSAGADLPDVWEAAYEGGLELSQAAAAEELLGNFGAAAHAYAKVIKPLALGLQTSACCVPVTDINKAVDAHQPAAC